MASNDFSKPKTATKDKPTKLKNLEIRKGRSYSDEDPNKYVCEIEWETQGSSSKIYLDPDISDRLLQFIGPVLVEFSARQAQEIAANIQFSLTEAKQMPAIEAESSAA